MGEVFSEIQNVKNIFGEVLVMGDHDTITLFGIRPQNNLKDYSRKLTTLLLKDKEELDMAIADVLLEIEKFEMSVKSTGTSWGIKRMHHKKIQKEYTKILAYIDRMTVYFKLQQAQLIKEIKLLEKLSVTVSDCAEELEQYIKIGKKILSEKEVTAFSGESFALMIDSSLDIDVWYERLDKRIADLVITHAISLQSQAQIKLLHDNNLLILDRIASTISNTFPIWQNQMAIMLGGDLMETHMSVQDRLANINNKCVEQTCREIMRKKTNEFQVDKLLELNQALSKALDEMVCLEKNNSNLRKEFLNAVDHMERG